MTNEFMHSDKNLKDATIFIKNLQDQVLQERLSKEGYQKSNYELKQNEMLLTSKVDLLSREKTNLQNQVDDDNKKMTSLNENIDKLNKLINDCKSDIYQLNNELHCSTDTISTLRSQLNDEKILMSQITATKETEMSDLNKFLNDTIQAHNNTILNQESKHRELINHYEINKLNMIDENNKLKLDLKDQ